CALTCCSTRPSVIFFFQAEDGIRDFHVTGVQTVLFRSRRRFYGGPAGLAEGVRHTAQAAAGAHGDPTGQSTDLAGGRGRFHGGGGGAPPVWAVRRLMQCCWRRRTR